MNYIYMIQDFMNFSCACRTNNLDEFMYSLGELIPLFFAADQQNYSRWMTRYQLNLMNANDKVKSHLENGGLSIHRTNKAFSRCPVDLTLY